AAAPTMLAQLGRLFRDVAALYFMVGSTVPRMHRSWRLTAPGGEVATGRVSVGLLLGGCLLPHSVEQQLLVAGEWKGVAIREELAEVGTDHNVVVLDPAGTIEVNAAVDGLSVARLE